MEERKDYSFSEIDPTAAITHRPLIEFSDRTLPMVGTSEALVTPSKDSWGRRVEVVSILQVPVLPQAFEQIPVEHTHACTWNEWPTNAAKLTYRA